MDRRLAPGLLELESNAADVEINPTTVEVVGGGANLSGISAETDICLSADQGTVLYDFINNLPASNELPIRTRDSFTVRAALPAQDINDGIVKIKIIESKLGEITIQGNERYRTEFLK